MRLTSSCYAELVSVLCEFEFVFNLMSCIPGDVDVSGFARGTSSCGISSNDSGLEEEDWRLSFIGVIYT